MSVSTPWATLLGASVNFGKWLERAPIFYTKGYTDWEIRTLFYLGALYPGQDWPEWQFLGLITFGGWVYPGPSRVLTCWLYCTLISESFSHLHLALWRWWMPGARCWWYVNGRCSRRNRRWEKDCRTFDNLKLARIVALTCFYVWKLLAANLSFLKPSTYFFNLSRCFFISRMVTVNLCLMALL